MIIVHFTGEYCTQDADKRIQDKSDDTINVFIAQCG